MATRLFPFFQLLVVIGLMSALVPTSLKTAHAAPAACATLQRQLVAASSGRSVSQKNSPLVQRQALQLQQVRAKASNAGCGGFLFSRGDPALCKRYAQTIDAMSAKLAKLQNASDRTGSSRPSRQQILASMEARGCNDRVASTGRNNDSSNVQRKSLLEVLFGTRADEEKPASRMMVKRQLDEREAHRRVSAAPETLAATYEGTEPSVNGVVKKGFRTICVRTCDGYYFPISFSTKPKYFARDQNACSAMCPVGNAKLYYHAVPEQESDAMISVADKQPYSELPNAFNYRTAGVKAVPGCTCHAQTDMMAAAPGTPVSQSKPTISAVKDTGKPDVDALSEEPAQGDSHEDEAPHQHVRTVGPAFFPDEANPTDFTAQPPENEIQESRASILTPENIVKTIASDIMRRIQ
ncbi:DUF2865 domain-containing protein [Phyllobacterium bourgognense]|uniref:Uncharacterized protein DUF2865 n=1 Tax=Phyllobacterium bourgognense TaxID=314236 RepID=A0A368YKC8_9HYPH|nr:DUF2865 domain-containing protein [Phyllobacterium bourgognense]RCW79776.1 uncharacterized protein DUF2865 [Phyllobacterium bourgognense]